MEPTSQYVENESSGDAHPVAGETNFTLAWAACGNGVDIFLSSLNGCRHRLKKLALGSWRGVSQPAEDRYVYTS